MLTVTPAASAALVSLLESPEIPDGAGVRLTRGAGPDGSVAIGLTIVSQPDPEDQIIEASGGIDVFLEAETADMLDDQQLDVEIDGENVAFSLQRQGLNGGPPDIGPA